MHDLLVVGGGPAGLAVALGAARAGLDVGLCERRRAPIDKACGEGLMPSAVSALAALGVDPPGFEVRGIRYLGPAHSVSAEFRAGPGRGVRRTTLYDSMHTAVVGSGATIYSQSVHDVTQFDDHVEAAGLRARYLVAADGLHSPIRARLGLNATTRAPHRWGQRRHYALAPGSRFVEVTWAARSEAYLTPVADDLIGVAVLSSTRAPFAEQLAEFPVLAGLLRDAEPRSDVRGAGPLRQRTRGRVAGRVLLVGDAAGYVDALTGEGIALSLAAAAELVACLVAGHPERYERAWRRVSRRTRLLTSGLLWARQRPALALAIVPAAERFPRVFAQAVNQLAG